MTRTVWHAFLLPNGAGGTFPPTCNRRSRELLARWRAGAPGEDLVRARLQSRVLERVAEAEPVLPRLHLPRQRRGEGRALRVEQELERGALGAGPR